MIKTGRKSFQKFAAIAAIFILASIPSHLQEKTIDIIQPCSVEGNGIYTSSIRFLVDGQTFPEGSAWNSDGCVTWEDLDTFFKLDLGEVFMVQNIEVQVDNDDGYLIECSCDDEEFEPLVLIDPLYKGTDSGLTTMSTLPDTPHYLEEMSIFPVEARYIKIKGLPGNKTFALSEIRIYGYLDKPPAQLQDQRKNRCIHPEKVQGFGVFSNEANQIIDGRIPPESLKNTGSLSVSWESEETYFIIDLGKSWKIMELKIQVDCDDEYRIEYSEDGENFYPLIDILPGMGEIQTGMDTLCSQPDDPEFAEGAEFHPCVARYLKVYSAGGEGIFALSELIVYGLNLEDGEKSSRFP